MLTTLAATVKGPSGADVINPLLQRVRGVVLVPPENAVTQTITARSGSILGGAAPYVLQTGSNTDTQLLAMECYHSIPTGIKDLFVTITIGGTGGQINLCQTPIPISHVFSGALDYATPPGLRIPPFEDLRRERRQLEYYSGPVVLSNQQWISFQFLNFSTTPRTINPWIEAVEADSEIADKVFSPHDRQVFPYWIGCESTLRVGGASVGLPGLNITPGQTVYETIFRNRLDVPFVASLFFATTVGTVLNNWLGKYEHFDPANGRNLQTNPVILSDDGLNIDSPFVFPAPVVIPPAGEMRFRYTNLDTASTYSLIPSLFGLALMGGQK